MTDKYCLGKVVLLPQGFHLKKSRHTPEIGFLEGTWKTQGFAVGHLRLTTSGDRSALMAILNHLLLRNAVFAHIEESCLKRHNGNTLFLACDFGDDPYIWPLVHMEHATALAFSLNALPCLRADPLILQYAHAETNADGQVALTVIAGTGARFAGDMTHVTAMRQEYAREKIEEQTGVFLGQIHALENRLQDISKENAHMRNAMAAVANGIDDELFRPQKRAPWPLGIARKNILRQAMIHAADELRAALSHAYSALL